LFNKDLFCTDKAAPLTTEKLKLRVYWLP